MLLHDLFRRLAIAGFLASKLIEVHRYHTIDISVLILALRLP